MPWWAFSLSVDRGLTRAVSRELIEAVDRCLSVVEGGQDTRFDVEVEAAVLIGPLANVDDDRAAEAARRVCVIGQTSGTTAVVANA